MAKKVRHKSHDALILYPRHRKPFRVRHLASLLVTLLVVLALTLELGVVIGQNHRPSAAAPAAPAPVINPPTIVRSGYGYSFAADSNVFDVSATETVNGASRLAPQDQLSTSQPLVSTSVRAKTGALSGRLAATQFSVQVNPDPAALTAAEQNPANAGLRPAQVAAKLFPVTASAAVSQKMLSNGADTLNGVAVQKAVYEFAARQGGGKSYAIQWSGVNKGRAFAVELNGLAGRSTVPAEFAAILDSLTISADQAVLGANTSVFAQPTSSSDGLDTRYLSDALSPAVVQIFHTVCGVLTVSGQQLGDSQCATFSGSGFLATEDGYIATNGHVVVYTAKDALADLVTSDESVLQEYLQGLGLSSDQIADIKSDPAALAALISRIYDMPDSELHFSNAGDLTLVALGSDQPNIKKLASITTSAQLTAFKQDTDAIKQASVVGYNYDAKDSLTAIADPAAGFSSSDVALLKVHVQRAPTIPIETNQVVQNERIVVMGFPGEANNPLTDNRQTVVTVTDGVISSIRQAAGGHGTLYQSDADASHGNSGGPAIDDQGRAIGLMTYRYADATQGDAAQSYIRDIADFADLADDNHVTINSRSSTQTTWENGLKLYSQNHYRAALRDFYKVRAAYPAQRLVGNYINSSNDAIDAGKDVPDVSVDWLLIGLAAALLALAGTVVVMVRHHALHRVYQTSVPEAAGQRPVYLAKPAVVTPPQPPAAPNSSGRGPTQV